MPCVQTDVEIVLQRPDTFTGSTTASTEHMWVLDSEWKPNETTIEPKKEDQTEEKKKHKKLRKRSARMEFRKITYVPALCK